MCMCVCVSYLWHSRSVWGGERECEEREVGGFNEQQRIRFYFFQAAGCEVNSLQFDSKHDISTTFIFDMLCVYWCRCVHSPWLCTCSSEWSPAVQDSLLLLYWVMLFVQQDELEVQNPLIRPQKKFWDFFLKVEMLLLLCFVNCFPFLLMCLNISKLNVRDAI